jgi:hypothetical protein
MPYAKRSIFLLTLSKYYPHSGAIHFSLYEIDIPLQVLPVVLDVLTRKDIESQRKGIIIITEAYMWISDEDVGTVRLEGGGGGGRSNYSLRFPNPKENPIHERKIITSMPSQLVGDSPSSSFSKRRKRSKNN